MTRAADSQDNPAWPAEWRHSLSHGSCGGYWYLGSIVIVVMQPSMSVCPPVCLPVECLQFSLIRKAVET